MHRGLHLRSSTQRLHEEGRGLVIVRTTIHDETWSTREYIRNMVPGDEVLRQLKIGHSSGTGRGTVKDDH